MAPFRQAIDEPEPHHLRNEHGDRLAEHRGLGFYPADAPADHAEPVDHRRVRIGADERIRIREHLAARFLLEDHAREILEVDLMDDAGVGRDDAEVVECFLAPAEERVSLLVARELERGVEVGGVPFGVMVDLHRVVDDELDRLQRIHLARVAAETHDTVAHGREVHDGGHAREILEQHSSWCEGDFLLRLAGHIPVAERLDVLGIDEAPVLAPQQVLEQDFQRVRQARDAGESSLLERRQAENLVRSPPSGELRACMERIERSHPAIIADNRRAGELLAGRDWLPAMARTGTRFATSHAEAHNGRAAQRRVPEEQG